MILVLQSTTFGAHGGIPTYNRVVCRVLNDFNGSTEKRVLVATDQPDDLTSHSGDLSHLNLKAFSGRRSAFVREVLRLAFTRKIDLALIGHVNYAPLGLMLRRLQPSLRYGVMVHGVDVWSRLPWIKRYALQQADFVTSVSQYTKEQVASVNGIRKERIHLLPNALEWCEHALSPKSQVPSPKSWVPAANGINLLSVCRLEKTEQYKGVDTVIAALPSVIPQVPGLHYFVIGSGTDLERHKLLAEEHSVADRVHFLGSVNAETLRAHYKACDIFVMPSAGEGFGFVFLEAMKYGKPIVAARSGGAPEVVRDGVNGKLVEYGNKHELLEALIDLCLNRNKREMLGAGGHRRLQENYTFEHFKEKFVDIIRLESRPQSARRFSPSHKSN